MIQGQLLAAVLFILYFIVLRFFACYYILQAEFDYFGTAGEAWKFGSIISDLTLRIKGDYKWDYLKNYLAHTVTVK